MNSKIEHEGIISKIDGHVITVRIIQHAACSGCHAQSVCAVSESKEKTIEIPHVYGSFQVGDSVIVEGSSTLGLKAVWYAFVVPLMLVVTVLALSLYYLKDEVTAAFISVIFLVFYYALLYKLKDRFKKKFVFTLIKR